MWGYSYLLGDISVCFPGSMATTYRLSAVVTLCRRLVPPVVVMALVSVLLVPAAGASAPRPPIPVLLVGDSTALTLGIGLGVDAAHYKVRLDDHGILGCGVTEPTEIESGGVSGPSPAACNTTSPPATQWPALWSGWIAQEHPRLVVILAGRWETADAEWGGSWTSILAPAYAGYITQQLATAVRVASSSGAHVVLLTAPCYDSGAQPTGQPWPQDSPARLIAYNRIVQQVAVSSGGRASVANLGALVCPDGQYEQSLDGVTVRAPDGVHFPFYSATSPEIADPDTESQVDAFGAWLGPRLWPRLLASVNKNKESRQ